MSANKLQKEPHFTPQIYPEIVIGLVSPLGVDFDTVFDELSAILDEVGYTPVPIKLSAALEETTDVHKIPLKREYEDERYESFMTAGNQLREKMGRMDALALLAMAQIKEYREKSTGEHNKSIPKRAYILRSLKNKEEIEILKSVYGESFFLISIYSPKETRKTNLTEKIAKSRNKPSQLSSFSHAAEKLIERDYDEQNEDFGQDVSGAFPMADLFVEAEQTKTKMKDGISRFIDMIFSHPFHSPSKDEFGMFLAFSSALRSIDLSRQVGAAVMNTDGDLLVIGCNEVPKFGGGQYWGDDVTKARDCEIGYDSSVYMKKEVLAETICCLQEVGLIDDKQNASDITDDLLFGEHAAKLKKTDIANLLEYGRMIHAEMAAISEAAKRGLSLQGATLYCTTFPCHMCSRHIIASGITRVVYIEPYPKSKAASLYQDSIVVDPLHATKDKVSFEPFVGVSPFRFRDLFKHIKRKNSKGKKTEWSRKNSKPKIKIYTDSYIYNEIYCISMAAKIIEDLKRK